jgi:pimeloyl-ACP methyl ester carboxylesterase
MAYRVDRELYGVAYVEKAAFKDTYGGEVGHVFIECVRLVPQGVTSDTVLVFSHPIGGGAFLPMVNELARAGHHVLFVNTRYRGNDTALIMEKCLLDLHAGIADARKRFGYRRVLLGGWSGGGSLSLFYQEQAEHPSITHTPAGDPVDIAGAGLVPADGIMLLAAHVSRAVILTEWLDPAVIDPIDVDKRDPAFDLYDPNGPNRPPYSADFVARFRAAQIARSRQITAWVKDTLPKRIAKDGPGAELAFTVQGTMADPRWLDPTLEPNERAPGTCYLGDPRVVNFGPVGLARFSTLRSWLSQWSFDESRANGMANGKHVSCPVLVVGNGADNACPPSHTQRLYDSIAHSDKELHIIRGAGHYYAGQAEKAREAVALCTRWMVEHELAPETLIGR